MSRSPITETQLRMELDLRVKKGHKLRDIAKDYGPKVNHAVVDRALKGRFPTSKDARQDLGLLQDEKTGCEYILELFNMLEKRLTTLSGVTPEMQGNAIEGIVCPVCYGRMDKVLDDPMSDNRYLYGCSKCEVEAYVPATADLS